MSPKRLRALLGPTFLLLLLCVASVLLLNSLIQRPSVQNYLLKKVSDAIGFELSTGKMEFSLWGGIGVSAPDLKAVSRLGPEGIIASMIRVTFDAGDLIKGHIIPAKIFLLQPRIDIDLKGIHAPPKPGTNSTLEKMIEYRLAGFPSITMDDARVCVKGLPFELRHLYYESSQTEGDRRSVGISLRTMLDFRGEEVPLSIKGVITQDAKALTDPFLEMTLKTGKVPLTWIPQSNLLHVKKGYTKADIRIEAPLGGPVSAEGKILAEDLRFMLLCSDKKKDYSQDNLALDFSANYSTKVFDISMFQVTGASFLLEGNSKINLEDSSDPHWALKVKGPFMPIKTFKDIFPSQLLPPWLENQLFPMFTAGEVRLDLFSLNGTLTQIVHLGMPNNARALSMEISCRDLEVFKNTVGLPLKGGSGNMAIDDGSLVVSDLRGNFGHSTISAASLDISGLYSKAPAFRISIDGSFDLHDLLQQGKMDLIPMSIREKIQGVGPLSGNLKTSVNLDFEKGWKNLRILEGEFALSDCLITHDRLILPLKIREGSINIDTERQGIFRGRGTWGNSLFQASGSAGHLLETAEVHIVGRADMNEIISSISDNSRSAIRFGNPVNCQATLAMEKGNWSCQGNVDVESMVLETKAYSIDPPGNRDSAVFNALYHPKKGITLTDFRCYLGKSCLELAGYYDLKEKNELDLKVFTEQLSIEDLGLRFKKTGRPAKGILKCRTEARISLRNPLGTSVTGEIEALGLSFALNQLPFPVNNCNFRLGFSGKEAFIHSMEMETGQSNVKINGHFQGWDGINGEMTLEAGHLDLSDFITNNSDFRSMTLESGQSRFQKKSIIRLKLSAAEAYWKDLKYGSFHAEWVLRAGDLFFNRFRLQMEHGILSVKGHIKGGKKPEILFSSYIKMTEQPLKPFLHGLGLASSRAEGLLTIEALCYMKGSDKKALLPSLTGSTNFLLEKGNIKEPHVAIKVLDFLSLQKIFQKRPPDLSKEGFYFKSIKGFVTADKGVLKTDNIFIKSPVFNAVAKGQVDLIKKQVDFDMGTQPLGTIDLVVSNIPIVGYVLTGKEKSLLIYYFKVNGPLSKPKVRYIPLKNLGNSMIGFLKRIFFTPGHIFKNLSRITQDLYKKGIPLPDEALPLDEKTYKP